MLKVVHSSIRVNYPQGKLGGWEIQKSDSVCVWVKFMIFTKIIKTNLSYSKFCVWLKLQRAIAKHKRSLTSDLLQRLPKQKRRERYWKLSTSNAFNRVVQGETEALLGKTWTLIREPGFSRSIYFTPFKSENALATSLSKQL